MQRKSTDPQGEGDVNRGAGWGRVTGTESCQVRWPLCPRGPAASPNLLDYFTPLGAPQHVTNKESASSSAQRENKTEKGDKIL